MRLSHSRLLPPLLAQPVHVNCERLRDGVADDLRWVLGACVQICYQYLEEGSLNPHGISVNVITNDYIRQEYFVPA